MVETTSNHGWEIPTVGGSEDTWGQILNDFFNGQLDELVTLSGSSTDRPAAGADTVDWYHSTDEEVIYYNDGSTWNEISYGKDASPTWTSSHSFESTLFVNDTANVHRLVVRPSSGDADFDLDTPTGGDATFKFVQDQTDQWSFHFRDSTQNLEYYNYNTGQKVMVADSSNNNVDYPNGTLSEQGNRVATRNWSSNNFLEQDGNTVLQLQRADNMIFSRLGQHDFELGLQRLEYPFGQFEVYDNSNRVSSTTNINTVYGLESNGNGYVELTSGSLSGNVVHNEKLAESIPDELVVVDTLRNTLADGADVYYEVEDDNGNVVTVTRDMLDSIIDVSQVLSGVGITVTAYFERDVDTTTSPQLDSWAVYMEGSEDAPYFEVTEDGTTLK